MPEDWPEDWPEDAKVGPKFLQEMMRRYPNAVKMVRDVQEFFGDDNKSEKPSGDPGTTKTGTS